MSFGTGSESGLDRGAFWRCGTLRQHSLGWQGAGPGRGGCQGCDGDIQLEPRGLAEAVLAARLPVGWVGWGRGGGPRGQPPQAQYRIFSSG